MELLSVIRRWRHRDQISIREIERRTGLSRNTIRKYLRSDAVEVRFKVPERPSRLDPFADKLSGWLELEAGKGRKARRTARRLHADLVALGYDGSYARVSAFVRHWGAERAVTQRTTGRGDLSLPHRALAIDGELCGAEGSLPQVRRFYGVTSRFAQNRTLKRKGL